MRKSLHEVQEIDRYLLRQMDTTDQRLFEARMLLSPDLEENVRCQQKAHKIIHWFARNQQRQKLESLYNRLMAEKDFSMQILSLFK